VVCVVWLRNEKSRSELSPALLLQKSRSPRGTRVLDLVVERRLRRETEKTIGIVTTVPF